MTEPQITVATSTADFTPQGIAGYTKFISGIAGFLGAVLIAVSPYLPDDPNWTKWVGGAIAACGAIGVYFGSNKIEPVQVVDPPLPPPAPQPEDAEEIDDEPGKHAVDNPGIQGVVRPPAVDE